MSNTDKILAIAHLRRKVNAMAKTKHPRDTKSYLKAEMKKAFDQRVMGKANNLFNAQASIALGTSYLFRVDKYEVKIGKGETEFRKKPAVIVTDPNEIKDYVDFVANGGVYNEEDETEYYYIHTAKPDNNAIDSMLNRTFGRAKETIEIDENITISLKDLAEERLKIARDVQPINSQEHVREISETTSEALIKDAQVIELEDELIEFNTYD